MSFQKADLSARVMVNRHQFGWKDLYNFKVEIQSESIHSNVV